MNNKNYSELLDEIIDKAFEKAFSPPEAPQTTQSASLYESIEDYEKKTGKRFRKTKEETHNNLSREQAFINRFSN
tara:strand:- start:128 stop:352 length:225 start_codon:yes stop_codon:yes gene_type:complete